MHGQKIDFQQCFHSVLEALLDTREQAQLNTGLVQDDVSLVRAKLSVMRERLTAGHQPPSGAEEVLGRLDRWLAQRASGSDESTRSARA